ncbi:ribosome maturation factor RimM [Pigmentiphaga soli]|uniref:Ribosome maturation factor RimM n=1 Tax=Pigmentiphaga soli TaxID=1007095 RepID=A0ABP8GYC2_9BURK
MPRVQAGPQTPLAPAVETDPPADLVDVGRVAEAYGVRGGIKVQPYSPQSEALLTSPSWWLRKGAGPVYRATVSKARRHGAAVTASWEGVADRDQAQAWRGWEVAVPRSAFPPPAEGEFYWVDLIGCRLIGLDADGAKVVLGTVAEVTDNGAHAILRVERVEPVAPGGTLRPLLDGKQRVREVLVPFVDAFIRDVDLAARQIDSDWPADF